MEKQWQRGGLSDDDLGLVPQHRRIWGGWNRTMRSDEFRNGGDGTHATDYYSANRVAMDEGAVVAWPERKKEDELSAIQNAMNLYYADRWSFFADR